MSTSPSPVREGAEVPGRTAGRVPDRHDQIPDKEILRAETQPFPYELITAARRGALDPSAAITADTADKNSTIANAARENQARALGRQEGQIEAEKLFADRLVREREGLAAALGQFTRDRATYFQKIEGEVVQLALAIARKILHREAQMDPLLLAGIVRVALEKIDGATSVVLRVHPENVADWHRYLVAHLEPANLPQIVEDPSLPLDRCTLETSMGTTDVGVEIQLKEIEQGLMDLLAARPEKAL
jgi:flagellar assembly protein FliH